MTRAAKGIILSAVTVLFLMGGAGVSLADPRVPVAAAPGPDAGMASDPRLPIPGSRTPAAPFVISERGSYRLAGNRLCAGDGIRVEADDVTIDLMGFSLVGPDTGNTVGIRMNGRRNIEIRDGTVRGFGNRGIHDKNEPKTAAGKRILNVRVIANGSCGICLGGDGNQIVGCFVADNKGTGLCCEHSLVERNIFLNNVTGGIAAGEGSRIVGNTVRGSKWAGISARAVCLVQGNVVVENGRTGIYAEAGSIVMDNIAFANNLADSTDGYGGIKVVNDSIVRGNSARANRRHDFMSLRSGNVVEGNLATAGPDTAGNGFFFGRPESFYAGNKASGNRADFAGDAPTGAGDGGGNRSLTPWSPPAPPPVPLPAPPAGGTGK